MIGIHLFIGWSDLLNEQYTRTPENNTQKNKKKEWKKGRKEEWNTRTRQKWIEIYCSAMFRMENILAFHWTCYIWVHSDLSVYASCLYTIYTQYSVVCLLWFLRRESKHFMCSNRNSFIAIRLHKLYTRMFAQEFTYMVYLYVCIFGLRTNK